MPYLIKASLNKQLWSIIKVVVLLLLLVFIYLKLNKSGNMPEQTMQSMKQVIDDNYQTLLLILLLMPLNWGLEALKWKILAGSIQRLSFAKAYIGVLTGLSLAFITPHGLGDYIGRIMQHDRKGRTRLVGAVMLGRLCQMIPTFSFGFIGVYYFVRSIELVIFMLITGLLFGAVLYLLYLTLLKHGKRAGHIRKTIYFYFGIISTYSVQQVITVLLLSFARYVIFALQFMVVLNLFLPELAKSIQFAGITWIFLVKSILPAFNFLSDLGVREFSAVYFFDQYEINLIPVVSASLTIWIINILVPSIVGAPFTLKMKFQSK